MTDNPRITAEFITSGSRIPLLDSTRLAIADYAEGLDLNRYRKGVDIRIAKQQGIRFIICKATQGTAPPHPDQLPTYEHYRDESKAKGLPFGAFHYWDARSDPKAQAQHFSDVAGGQLDLLPKLDVEKYGNEGVLSQNAAAQHIQDTAQEIINLFAPDYAPGKVDCEIYTNQNSWGVLTGNSSLIAAYPLWAASWTTAANPSLPIGATDWLDWQYTNQYQVAGYPKGIDANRFHGNEGQFEDYVKSLSDETPPGTHDHPDLEAEIEEIKAVSVGQAQRITANEAEIENLNAIATKHDKDISAIVEQLHNQNDRITKLENQMSGIGKAASE
jgi:GH25 family lysozyme M1 (1,4-beta-N-acetylmuramidase)